MGLLEKIENAINFVLIKLGELMLKLLVKMIPAKIKDNQAKVEAYLANAKVNLRQLPKVILTWLIKKLNSLKQDLLSYDYKGKLKETYGNALARYKNESPEKMGKLKTVVLTPFLMMGEWLRGLSTTQSVLLVAFTCGSFLAAIEMYSSGQRIVNHELEKYRAPAAVEEEVTYDRPGYYKKQNRHFEVTNMRIPVYVANVNELKSVDIDFTATVSNRLGRMALEKYEFQLRDYIILHIEPSVASFPLEQEGKDIIKDKLWKEINDFMRERKIEGEVVELRLTYILAN